MINRNKIIIFTLLAIFTMLLFDKVYPGKLDAKNIFEQIIQNQTSKKRFLIKGILDHSFTIEGEEGGMRFLCESSIDADFNNKTFHIKSNLRQFFLDSKEAPISSSREYYISDKMLVIFDERYNRWVKVNEFITFLPTFLKSMELIRVGGFFDYRVKDAFNPPLDEMLDFGFGGVDKIDPTFPMIFSILFTGFSYTTLDITEFHFNEIPCYQLDIKISEDDIKRYVFGQEDLHVYELPTFVMTLIAAKDKNSILALRYRLEIKGRGPFFSNEVDYNMVNSGEFIYTYPKSSLELPKDVKNAEDDR